MRETVKIRMLAFRVLTFNRAVFEKCQTAQRRKTLFCGKAVRELDEKKAQGIGMFTVDGKMIDIAFCDGAKRTLAPDGKRPEIFSELDERLFATSSIALERRRTVADHMAETVVSALRVAFQERHREYQRKYALP